MFARKAGSYLAEKSYGCSSLGKGYALVKRKRHYNNIGGSQRLFTIRDLSSYMKLDFFNHYKNKLLGSRNGKVS